VFVFLLEFSAIDAIRILKYFWGTIHSTLFCLFRLGELIKIMAGFNMEEVMEKYENKTVLAISPPIINQITAEKIAREEMVKVGARLPPANVRYNIYCFAKKIQRHPIRAYLVFNYPAPPEIERRHLWNATDLEESFYRAHGKYINHSNP